jgi:hypothetical protein
MCEMNLSIPIFPPFCPSFQSFYILVHYSTLFFFIFSTLTFYHIKIYYRMPVTISSTPSFASAKIGQSRVGRNISRLRPVDPGRPGHPSRQPFLDSGMRLPAFSPSQMTAPTRL